jgi:hypothetical protein
VDIRSYIELCIIFVFYFIFFPIVVDIFPFDLDFFRA